MCSASRTAHRVAWVLHTRSTWVGRKHAAREHATAKVWPYLLALKGLNHGRLLAADIGAGATMNVDIKVVTRSSRVLAKLALLVRLGHSLLQRHVLVVVLTTDVDVSSLGNHGGANDEAALNQLKQAALDIYRRALINHTGDPDFTSTYARGGDKK